MTSGDDDLKRRPAPFTPEQVEELVRGTLPEEAVAAVLQAFPGPSETKQRRSRKHAPIELEEEEIRRIAAEGSTSAELEKRLDAAAKADRRKLPRQKRAARPTKRPPR